MDALSDPRAFLSAQEKRTQQMKAMGIEESDISSMNIKPGNTTGGPATKKSEGVRFQDEPKGKSWCEFLLFGLANKGLQYI